MRFFKPSVSLFLSLLVVSCATYYEVNYEFNRYFESGQIKNAEKVLADNQKISKGKAQFLYYANQGVVNAMLGNLEESNRWFEEAYEFGERYEKNYGAIAASFLVNPTTITYRGEDHEQLLLLYYKAINLMKMKQYESALIECRRLINRLNALSDKYKSDQKYKSDAFIHLLMGIIFEATDDHNNAFIAYRNAFNIYENEYQELFGLSAPDQLKEDLLRTAALSGFMDQVDFYERKFGKKYTKKESSSELVFFWHNGLGPVKDEWSVNFTAVDGGVGFVTFESPELGGLTFPYSISSDDQKKELTDLRVFRVAFPKYVERNPYFSTATLTKGDQIRSLELAEDINKIAFKTLNERMLEEFGKGLLRVAVKKSIEQAVRGNPDNEDDREEAVREGLSMVVGMVNAFTEKADTRNWQTIPHDIYYTRVPLSAGENEVSLKTYSSNGKPVETTFSFNVKQRETVFHSYHSLETQP